MLPTDVRTAMGCLCSSLTSHLPDTIEAVYIYGSAALDAYIEGSSDIDFIAIVRRPLAQSDIRAIADAHAEVEKQMPAIDMTGAYMNREDLGKEASGFARILTYYNKRAHTDGTGADLNPVTWWVLQKHGICVYGEHLPFTYEMPAGKLVEYVIGNMNTYWAGWIERLSKLNSEGLTEQKIQTDQLDEAVEWCVLGMLRQLYTVSEHDVTSKTGAGVYGLAVMPERWHMLIREAIAVKRRQPKPEYDSQLIRLQDLVDLLKTIHTECNRIFHIRRM